MRKPDQPPDAPCSTLINNQASGLLKLRVEAFGRRFVVQTEPDHACTPPFPNLRLPPVEVAREDLTVRSIGDIVGTQIVRRHQRQCIEAFLEADTAEASEAAAAVLKSEWHGVIDAPHVKFC